MARQQSLLVEILEQLYIAGMSWRWRDENPEPPRPKEYPADSLYFDPAIHHWNAWRKEREFQDKLEQDAEASIAEELQKRLGLEPESAASVAAQILEDARQGSAVTLAACLQLETEPSTPAEAAKAAQAFAASNEEKRAVLDPAYKAAAAAHAAIQDLQERLPDVCSPYHVGEAMTGLEDLTAWLDRVYQVFLLAPPGEGTRGRRQDRAKDEIERFLARSGVHQAHRIAKILDISPSAVAKRRKRRKD